MIDDEVLAVFIYRWWSIGSVYLSYHTSEFVVRNAKMIVYRITKIVLMQYMYSHEEFLNYVKNISSKKLKKFVESMFYVHVGLMCAQMSLDKNNLVIISNACNKLLWNSFKKCFNIFQICFLKVYIK